MDKMKQQLDVKISKIMNDLGVTIENNKYLATEDEFQKLKMKLSAELTENQNDYKYTYHYYMRPASNFTISEYKIVIHITKDCELITTYTVPFTITITQKDIIDYNEVKDTSLYELLYNTPYEDELVKFYNKLVEYEPECTVSGEWTLFTRELTKPEVEYFRTLNEHEKEIFAKAHSFTYAADLIYGPLNILFDVYDMEMINTFFNKIQFTRK